jgi:tRNA1Val (adenine37-N6)-methyltransferase
MKIGTDGVLLGAWASVTQQPFSVLDIGAGTGIISLMMAQRSDAEIIDAIEIDDHAFEQCTDNFENSPWGDRLFCYHAGLDEFVDEIEDQYDLIVSNPPFFNPNYNNKPNTLEQESRNLARFQDALPFDQLLDAGSKLLSADGIFALIIPYQGEEHLITIAKKLGLYPIRITHIKGNPSTEIKRSLIEFSRTEQPLKHTTIIIEKGRHEYTEDYINLTKDFYIKM